MHAGHLTFDLTSSEETAQVAANLADRLAPGDTVLLNGSVGAGKTHFARHLIREILDAPEDIPSPTFTLVQTYDTRRGPLWHSDLYRIGATQEIEELGLLDAFESAICLVEWPDRLGDLRPADALDIWLHDGSDEDARRLEARWQATKWSQKLAGWTKA